MLKLTNKRFYEEHNEMYNVLSDFVHELPEVTLLDVTPVMTLEIQLDDCYLDEKGNLYVPCAYEWLASKDEDDGYHAHYNEEPTLTKLEIANMIAQVEEPELNDKARNIIEEDEEELLDINAANDMRDVNGD